MPDPDEPGQVYGDGVAGKYDAAGAASIRMGKIPAEWQVPNRKNGGTKGWGFGDPLPDGVTIDDVLRIVKEAQPWQPRKKQGMPKSGDDPLSNGHDHGKGTARPKPGDRVQVEVNGAYVFKEPVIFREIQTAPDGKEWGFVEGSDSGAPLDAFVVIETREARAGAESGGNVVRIGEIEATVARLATLSETEYQTVRRTEAAALGKIPVSFLDKRVKEARKAAEPESASHRSYPFELIDLTQKGAPVLTSIANVKAVLDHLGIHLWQNDFTCIPEAEGGAGCFVLDDHGVSELWRRINALCLFMTDHFVAKAWKAIAKDDRRHHIRDWLDGLTHDKKPRLERLFIDYTGAPDTAYNRALGLLHGRGHGAPYP